MALIIWSDDYSVKVRQFDEQHKKLIGIVNQLHDAMRSGKGSQILGDIFTSLAAYTEAHFADEERLMQQHGYPGLVAHKMAHNRLVEQVRGFRKGAEAGGNIVTQDVMTFLKDWLIRHIQGEDAKYGPHLNAKGVA